MIAYRHALEQYDRYMKNAFSLSQPSSKFGKWGTNLARCGVEVALRLVKRGGLCGIVSPASFLNDQVSRNLRSWMFENYRVLHVSYYPAELKLYGSADISSVMMIVQGGDAAQNFPVRTFQSPYTYTEENIDRAAFAYMRRTGFCIPLKTGMEAIPVLMRLELLPSTKAFCDRAGLHVTRELDETRVKEKLLPGGRIAFAKGYMVDRYKFAGESLFLNEEMVVPPLSSYRSKVVWRDVSRDSQSRRIKATLLPPGYICGNSLGVIYGDKAALPSLKMLLAVMNSMVYEYQARSMLVSNHVSAGIVKQIRVPQLNVDVEIVELVDRRLRGEDVEEAIELAVALRYGLSPEEFAIVIDSFDLEEEKRTRIVREYGEKWHDGETSR